MDDLPFIFVSDLDMHVIQVLLNLENGSKNQAFLSNILTCSKLMWYGVPAHCLAAQLRSCLDRCLAARNGIASSVLVSVGG